MTSTSNPTLAATTLRVSPVGLGGCREDHIANRLLTESGHAR
jgi:hypothetical protein